MRIICLLTILSLSLLFVGCSSDDLVAVDEQPTHIPAGAYEEECKWIYAQMNHDYLWREDLPDSASCDYGTDPVTFFKSLLSDKDRFSYCERNTSYSPPAEIVNMGFEYQMYSSGADEFAQVLYVTSQELKRQGLRRGDLVKFDKAHIFRGELRGNNFIPTDTLEAVEPQGQTSTVYLDSIYYVESKKVGYMCYLEFDDTQDLLPVLRKFYDEHIDELVLDLRYNPGGYLNMAQKLGSMLAPQSAQGQPFVKMTYNDKLNQEEVLKVDPALIPGGTALNYTNLYILTTSNTASASEVIINCLKPYLKERLIQVGTATFGKNIGQQLFTDEQAPQLEFWLTTIYLSNSEGFKDYFDNGLTPDYEQAEDMSGTLGEFASAEDALIQPVFTHIQTGSFPVLPEEGEETLQKSRGNSGKNIRILYNSIASKPHTAKNKLH